MPQKVFNSPHCTCINNSTEQQHAPNKPYQLGTDCEDVPENGIVEYMKLKVGDYIVFGTDGKLQTYELLKLIVIIYRSF